MPRIYEQSPILWKSRVIHDRKLKKEAAENPDWIVVDGIGPEELQEVVDEHRVLREAIEKNPMPYGVFDASQKLVVANEAYTRLHPTLVEVHKSTNGSRSIYYDDIVRAQLRSTFSGGDIETEVQRQVEEFKQADGTQNEMTSDVGRRYKVLKYQLTSGGTADIAFDITELRIRETEISAARSKAEEASEKANLALESERIRKQKTNRLSELGEWLQSCKSLDELYRIVSRFMGYMFPNTSGELYIYSNSRDVLDGACHWSREGRMHAHIQADDCWALRRGRMLNYGTGFAELKCEHVADQDIDDEIGKYVCIPITAHGDTVGLLHISFDQAVEVAPSADANWDMNLVIQCAEQISLAIANVKLRDELHEQSTRDPLTGLFNRRYFMNLCRQQFVTAQRANTSFSIISLDTDNFKSFNDIHGHDAGDTVLSAVANAMMEVVNDFGTPARLGGEEFAVLLPDTDIKAAIVHAENLRAKIAALIIPYAGKTLPAITVSGGVATSELHGTTPHDILLASDVALYAAKDAGRNRIVAAKSK
jgi:diguanylate cyclase (GGDEF)-like protein